MKKLMALFLVFALCLSLAACASEESTASPDEAAEPTSAPETSAPEDVSVSPESLGEIEVEENLFNVEITLPSDFVGDATQDELDAAAEEVGVHSITLNEDGSATYVMSKKQHEQLLAETADSINQSLEKMVGSEETPNITAVTAKDDFTHFTVTTTSTELGLSESMSVISFYMYGGMYGIFSGHTPDNIHVDFVNEESGDIIFSTDSSQLGQ